MQHIIFKIAFCLPLLLLTGFSLSAQTAHRLLREGDEAYLDNDYKTAEEQYRKALEKKQSAQGQYNLGNSIYNQERYEEAIRQYESAADAATDDLSRANAFYNLGNAHLKNQALDKSVEAYKNTLRLNPADQDAKFNLSLAKQLLRQQQQQQQQQQQDDQEKKDEEEKQDQEEQQQQQNQDQNQEQNEGDEDQEQQQPQQSEDQVGEKDLNKEEAERLLEIMEEEERKVQEKMRKQKAGKSKSDKDW